MAKDNKKFTEEEIKKIVQSEIKKFAIEFLPSIEENIKSISEVSKLNNKVIILEKRIGNIHSLVQTSLSHIEEVSKTVQLQKQFPSKTVSVFGEYQNNEKLKTSAFLNKKILELENKKEIQFLKNLMNNKENEKDNKLKKSISSPKIKNFEKRILKLEQNQKDFENNVTQKLDNVLNSLSKISFNKKTNINNNTNSNNIIDVKQLISKKEFEKFQLQFNKKINELNENFSRSSLINKSSKNIFSNSCAQNNLFSIFDKNNKNKYFQLNSCKNKKLSINNKNRNLNTKSKNLSLSCLDKKTPKMCSVKIKKKSSSKKSLVTKQNKIQYLKNELKEEKLKRMTQELLEIAKTFKNNNVKNKLDLDSGYLINNN